MNEEVFTKDNLTDEQIRGMFYEYVSSKEDEERHSKAACEEVDAFGLYSKGLFPGDVGLQNETYDRMMSVAVSFEEDGFVAGVKWVLDLVRRGLLIPSAEEKSEGELQSMV